MFVCVKMRDVYRERQGVWVCVYGGRDEVWVFVSVWRLEYVCRYGCVCVFINIEMVVLW